MKLHFIAIGGSAMGAGFFALDRGIVEEYDTGFAASGVELNGKLINPWGAIKSD